MNVLKSSTAYIALIIIICLGIRGSIGPVPISRNENTSVSSNSLINDVIMNPLFAIKEAYVDFNGSSIITDSSKILNLYNQKSYVDALSKLRNLSSTSHYFHGTTPIDPNLENNPPNVVFILVESLSNYYSILDSLDFNLLGNMREHYKEDFYFQRFLSYSNHTINSLEGILIASPQQAISQSIYVENTFETSIAKPYYENNYHTTYITAAKNGWRNLNAFIPRQYFDSYISSATILSKNGNKGEIEWGVLDEYMYDEILNQLEQKNDKPNFIFGLTVTNHTPYDIPENKLSEKIKLPDRIKNRLCASEEIATKSFNAFRYTNDQLAKFISRIKNSKFGKNTIIAVSGDHNTGHAMKFDRDEILFFKYSVPFYLYVPDKYKKGVYIKNRAGSHKDIFPTLYHLSLSNSKYFNTGNYMFAKGGYFWGINQEGEQLFSVDEFGTVMTGRWANIKKWESPNSLFIKPTSMNETPELKSLEKKAKAYKACMYLINQQELRD